MKQITISGVPWDFWQFRRQRIGEVLKEPLCASYWDRFQTVSKTSPL